MESEDSSEGPGIPETQQPALRSLVESALRTLASNKAGAEPKCREQWITELCEALMSDSETSHRTLIARLGATGVGAEDILQNYIPAAARRLGEMWLMDEASFVDVTVGASRLQALFRERGGRETGQWTDRSIPLGQSVLMVIPQFEQHSLGAFVTADNLRRHGLWVHMAVGLTHEEIVELLHSSRFAMVGITVGSEASIDLATGVIRHLRAHAAHVPPIVVGGQAAAGRREVERRTGADFVVQSAREAIERCGLSTIAEPLAFDQVT